MLDRLLRRRQPLLLRFERRECVIVPQTSTRLGLHADVHFLAQSPSGEAVIEDAHLLWEAQKRHTPVRRSRWDRAIIEGKFRYPPQPLEIIVGGRPRAITLTFTDPLIPHGPEAPPTASRLVLELVLDGGRRVRRDLWRVELTAWNQPATTHWIAKP